MCSHVPPHGKLNPKKCGVLGMCIQVVHQIVKKWDMISNDHHIPEISCLLDSASWYLPTCSHGPGSIQPIGGTTSQSSTDINSCSRFTCMTSAVSAPPWPRLCPAECVKNQQQLCDHTISSWIMATVVRQITGILPTPAKLYPIAWFSMFIYQQNQVSSNIDVDKHQVESAVRSQLLTIPS